MLRNLKKGNTHKKDNIVSVNKNSTLVTIINYNYYQVEGLYF